MISRQLINQFFKSKLFSDIEGAVEVLREFEFGIYRDAAEFTENPEIKEKVAGTKIYVQGAIDLILIFPDGRVYVCDYKTDRPSAEERADISLFHKRLRLSHKDQLAHYKEAITQIFGKEPDKMFIYSLPLGDTVEV